MLRKWGAFVLLLLTMPALAFAQSTGKLAGVVTDAATGEPLPGANVVLVGTNLGTAADVDGNYFIIGVPVGVYDVQASFVGFQSSTVANVEINSGYTREINFSLAEGTELAEIVVEYERPLIQKDAIGAPRTVTGEDIQNLPVRGTAAVAALQGGVISNETSNNLFIRGGREQEVVYYVDGVKIIGGARAAAVPQSAVQEQEMLIGTVPARYGDVQSGVITITTKSGIGSEFFGTVEAITSEVLDDFGYNLGSVAVGGPIVQRKLSFFASVEGVFQADTSPYGIDTYTLDDDVFNALQDNPQVVEVLGTDGNTRNVAFPGDIEEGTDVAGVEAALLAAGLISDGEHLTTGNPQSAAFFLTEDDFTTQTGKDHAQADINVSANLTFQPSTNTSLRLSGGFNNRDNDTYNFTRSLYANDVFYETNSQTWRAAATWRQYLSNSTFYEITADYSNDYFVQYPTGFSDDIRDALFYGDVDGVDANGNPTAAFDVRQTARNYWQYDVDSGTYIPRYQDGSLPSGSGVYGLFGLPGTGLTRYIQRDRDQFRLSANATTQVGLHQIEFGGEFEQRTERNFDIAAGQLARYYNDGNPEVADQAVDRYEDLDYDVIESLIVGGTWYGYDYLGLNEVDDGDVDAFAAGTNYNIAPYEPVYYAGYVRDKIEFRDIILDLGLRVDVFDNNTQVLVDPFAFNPIVRAGDVQSGLPSNIEDDYAVYFEAGNSSNDIVGFRGLDGTFYDETGAETNRQTITNLGANAPSGAALSTAFEDYEPQVTFQPRLGVSFPVTDQALFFASYNVLAQRPTERSFLPAQLAIDMSSGSAFDNSALEPEVTTQYELGFRQRLGARAALQLSGFYRTQKNKIGRRTLNASFPNPGYYGHFNVDFTTTKGATFEFDLRRTRGVAMNANYTLSFAEGTGSDAATAATIAWRGTYFPDFIAPAGFDRRHSLNVSLDYRLGEGEGPMVGGTHLLQNFGVNLLAVIQSGQPFTQLQTPVVTPVFNQTNNFIFGGVNEARFPWTNRIDLRVDRRFALSGRASLTAFVWVANLLDTDNIFGVFRGSGVQDDDGFLSGGGAGNAIAAAQDADSYIFHYDYLTDDPNGQGGGSYAGGGIGLPRRTRLGVRLNF